MPLIALLKIIFALLSLLILGAAGYLLWSWWDGDLVQAADGVGLVFVRDGWRLWTGLGLLAWSFLGRPVVNLFLARGDTDPTTPRREAGVEIAGR